MTQTHEQAEQGIDGPIRTERVASPEADIGIAVPTLHGLKAALPPGLMLSLQRTAGNAAVSRLVSGAPGSRVPRVQRADDVEAAAAAGAADLWKGQAAAPSLVLRVGNDRDMSIAESFLRVLKENQPKIEAGARMASPTQDSSRVLPEIVHGEEHKLQTQVPPEAIATNSAVMTDLELYLVQGKRLSTGTSQFQDHYRVLLTEYGRLEGIATNYAGVNLNEVSDVAGVESMVDNAVGAGGHSPEELSATFNEMLKSDPNVSRAQDRLQTETQRFEEVPARLSTDMTAANGAVATFDNALVALDVATAGVTSLRLRQGFAAEKKKLEDAKKLSGKVTSILLEGAKEGAKEAAVAMAGTEGRSAQGAPAPAGGPAGALAIGQAAADKFVLDPLKDAVRSALANADAAVGEVDGAERMAMAEEAEKVKQDASTLDSFKAAKATLASAKKGMQTDVERYVRTAIEFDQRRLATRTAFAALGTAIEQASKTRGKVGQGKALSEMLSFLKSAEEFVVQANAVTDIGQKELTSAPPPGGSGEDESSGPAAAAEAMKKWDGKSVWMAHEYPFTLADGTVVTYYGAQEVRISVSSYNMDINDETQKGRDERRGLGSAEGGSMSVSAAIPTAIENVERTRAKVLAIRTAIATKVFGSGGG